MQNSSEKMEILASATRILDAGGVVGIPTETVYGLAARIDREAGLREIFALKERPLFDPLIVHLADIDQVSQVAEAWNRSAQALAEAFWPGPLTLVVPKTNAVNPLITAGLDTVGIRIPRNELTRSLIRQTGAPLAAPSANKFKKTSPTEAAHVRREFPELLLLDDGAATIGIESTVVRVLVEEEGALEILRPGMISAEELALALTAAGISPSVRFAGASNASPGMLEEHYQPRKPLVLLDRSVGASDASLREAQLARGFSAPSWLELGDDPRLAARRLYAELHRLSDVVGSDHIVVVKDDANSDESWRAIWDRLGRAASLKLRA